MVCNPNDNSLNPPLVPGIPLPGFGIPFSPLTMPLPDFSFPEGFPENLLDLINQLGAIFPSGEFKPNLDDLTNSILKAISSVLNQIAPFLSLYRFFQAFMNMLLCVLEILCAIPNPFKMIKAMRRLFKRCLPQFLNLFPWLALLAMLIALLLLILALIEYIIRRILQLIEDIIRNLTILGEGLSLQNPDATVAAAQKIAQLLCLIDNLLAIFVAIAAVLSIIEALAGIQGRTVCGRGANAFGDDVGCCDEEVCPPFIRDNQDGIPGLEGKLIYYKELKGNESLIFGGSIPVGSLNLAPLRPERWQFVNDDINQLYHFYDIIINPYGEGDPFFPEGKVYTKDSKPRKVPYTLDATLSNFDVSVFNSSDTGGIRDFVIKDLIINRPYVGVYNKDNQLDTTVNEFGTLPLVGGKVFEADGTTPYIIGGKQATIETFMHSDPSLVDTTVADPFPIFDDGYVVSQIDFNLVIRHEILMDEGLITLGCIPDLALETEVVNARVGSVGFDSVTNRLGDIIPDVAGAQECATAALAKFRENVSLESAAVFQEEMLDCLNNLRSDTLNSVCELVKNGVSIFESEVKIDIPIQFITRPIVTTVTLKDVGGTNLAANLPEEIADSCVSSEISGSVTLGQISNFEYDGYGEFKAEITSDDAGDGELTISFANNIFSRVLNSDDDTVATAIEVLKVPYTFIGSKFASFGSDADREAGTRRDETDVSGSGGSD